MRSKTHYNSTYGPPSAVLLTHLHHAGTGWCQDCVKRCSVNENVSRQRTVLLAPSSCTLVTDVPVFRAIMRSYTRKDHRNDYSMAVSSILTRFPKYSRYRRLDGTKLCNDEACCPVRKLVSNRRVAPTAPLPAVSTRDLPRSQQPTCSKARYDPSCSLQTAAPSAILRSR